MRFAVTLLVIVIGAVCAVVFRPFWASEWGTPTFILAASAAISLVAGSGGRGKPYSLSFGFAFGAVFAVMLLVAAYVHPYVGLGVGVGLMWLGTKTQFVARRLADLRK
ncbi:MAG TPA: hypothetical protein VGN98_11945 [Tianweitania sediminis]|jgi:hypothetical protein|nr:hypothetical protein [Tianweitania sediminis]